ncbi:nucleotidyl transferase AbiEii/AbiGii toxin family protein [Oenococcus sp.]|uniref:nucleotidyl transferase AbiEii/AbiGii toxin family protein n=1 Tax=Oenococcus sp. TaxID=1979414 RepID=UPI0039EB7340
MNNQDRAVSLRDRLKQQRKNSGVDITTLTRKYFIDGFLVLLAHSQYRNYFIWKGGFVLSAITGIEERTTVDVDSMLHHMNLSIDQLAKVVTSIVQGQSYHGTVYHLVDIKFIQEEKDYAGLRVRIQARLGNLTDNFHLDIATDETLIPTEIKYNYLPLLSTETIPLMFYRPERILAEKVQTVLVRSVFNTRMKDFYDIYTLFTTPGLIDNNLFISALKNILEERGSIEAWQKRINILQEITNDANLAKEWRIYSRKHAFVKETSFSDTLSVITKIFQIELPS